MGSRTGGGRSGGRGGGHRGGGMSHSHSHYHGGHYGHHHYGYQDDDCCTLFICLAALVGACVPAEKKASASIGCQLVRVIMLFVSILLIILNYCIYSTGIVSGIALLEKQFPYQIYIDPKQIGDQIGKDRIFKFQLTGYEFYTCDFSYNPYIFDDRSYKSGSVSVKGDFTYNEAGNIKFWAQSGDYTIKTTYSTDMNSPSGTPDSDGFYQINTTDRIQILNTNNETFNFKYEDRENTIKDYQYCKKLDGDFYEFNQDEDVYGYPMDTSSQPLTAVSISTEYKDYSSDPELAIVGWIILVVYCFFGLISLAYFQNCILCCGLFCSRSQAFKDLKNPKQQVTVIRETVVQQPSQPQTVIIQQPTVAQPVPMPPPQQPMYQQPQPAYQYPTTVAPPTYQQPAVAPPMESLPPLNQNQQYPQL